MTMPRVLRSVSCLVEVDRAARREHSARRELAMAGAVVREVADTMWSRVHRRAPARKALTEVESMVVVLVGKRVRHCLQLS